jgi:hypothetical protein
MLRCRSIASLRRTVSTPPLVDFSRASHLDLFAQPAICDRPETALCIPAIITAALINDQHARVALRFYDDANINQVSMT